MNLLSFEIRVSLAGRLAVLLVFVLLASAQVVFPPKEPTGAPGNPLYTGGPFPSLIPYASLNAWDAPNEYAKGSFEKQARHIGAAHGDLRQAAGMLNVSKNFYFVRYRLLESELTSDPSIGEGIRYCTKVLGHSDPEALFYHYENETVLNGVAIKTISRKSDVVTVTLADAYILDASVPDMVVVKGVPDESFNGEFRITRVLSATQFKYVQKAASGSSNGGSAALKIAGCGTSSSCPASTRIVNPAFGSPPSRRYLWNHGDETCVRPYLKYRSLRDVTQNIEGTRGHFRAIFWDELGQADFCTIGHSPIGCTAMPLVKLGGKVKEFGVTAQQAVDAHTYDDRLNGLLQALTAELHAKTRDDAINFPNAAQCAAGPVASGLNVSCYNHAMSSDGTLTEFWDEEGQGWMGSTGVQVLWRSADAVLQHKKIFIWAQDNTVPGAKTYGVCGDHYKSNAMRHQMWSLSNYWMIKQGNYAWYTQQPVAGETYMKGFIAAQLYDIGKPTGNTEACFDVAGNEKTKCLDGNRYLWKDGIDSVGQKFQIHRRNYSGGIVLSTPRTSNEDGFPPNYSATTADFSLPGSYAILQGDGTVGAARTTINMCRFEGTVLVRASTSRSKPTIPP